MATSLRQRYREAFKERLHLVALGIGIVIPLLAGQPLALLAVALLELCYLIFVPPSAWYAGRLQAREDAATRRQREAKKAQILPTLHKTVAERYTRLEAMHRQACDRTHDVQQWFTDAPRKYDYLLDTFLDFAGKQATLLQYLASVYEEECGVQTARYTEFNPYRKNERPAIDPSGSWAADAISNINVKYTAELAALKEKIAQETDSEARSLLVKHAEILTSRAEFTGKLAGALTNIGRQLQVLEDTFGLVNDQMAARQPEEILANITDVVSETNAMTRVLDEVTTSDQLLASLDRLKITS